MLRVDTMTAETYATSKTTANSAITVLIDCVASADLVKIK